MLQGKRATYLVSNQALLTQTGLHRSPSRSSCSKSWKGDSQMAFPLKAWTIMMRWSAYCRNSSLVVEACECRGECKDTRLLSVLTETPPARVTQILQGFGPVGADGRRELKLRDSKSKTTLRHLLTHSAGLSYYWTPDVMVEYFKPTQGLAHGNLAFATGKIDDFTTPAVQEAGISMEYSAVADWLGQVGLTDAYSLRFPSPRCFFLSLRSVQRARTCVPSSWSSSWRRLASPTTSVTFCSGEWATSSMCPGCIGAEQRRSKSPLSSTSHLGFTSPKAKILRQVRPTLQVPVYTLRPERTAKCFRQ